MFLIVILARRGSAPHVPRQRVVCVRANSTRLLPPMGFGQYKNISASDLDALVGYLRSLPAR